MKKTIIVIGLALCLSACSSACKQKEACTTPAAQNGLTASEYNRVRVDQFHKNDLDFQRKERFFPTDPSERFIDPYND